MGEIDRFMVIPPPGCRPGGGFARRRRLRGGFGGVPGGFAAA